MRGNDYVRLYGPIALAFTLTIDAHAETSADLIVSATRTARPLDSIGSSITTLTENDLIRGQYAFLADALRVIPGAVVAQNGGTGSVAGIRLRGSSVGQTLVVIDGVRANDPASPQGGFNAGNLVTAGIERVEILRGPQGLAWGADAIGGVVSVETSGVEAPSLSAFAEGGSFATARGAASFAAGRRGAEFIRAQISGVSTRGFSRAADGVERDGYRALTGSLRAGTPLSHLLDGEFIARIQTADAEIDGFPPPAFDLGDTDETEETDEYGVTARVTHRRQGDTGASGALTLGLYGIDRKNFNTGAQTFSAAGRRISAGYILDVATSRFFTVTAGAEAERQSVDVSGIDENAERGGVFVIAEWRLSPTPSSTLNVSAGARRDEFSNFEGATTVRAAAAWSFSESIVLRASWGEGYRAPTLFELNFSQFGVNPNPDLRPERARGYDVSVEWRRGAENPRVLLGATFFDTRTRDQIDFSFAQNGYFNVSRSRARGVEAQASFSPSDWLTTEATYTYLDAADLDSNQPALRQPRHRGSAIATITPSAHLALAAALLVNGQERDVPTDNDTYARLDLRASYALSPRLTVHGRIENATDTDYQDVSGFNETRRAAYAGLRFER